MLDVLKLKDKDNLITTQQGLVQELNLNTKFSFIACVFSVFCYLTNENDLRRSARAIASHLSDGGKSLIECTARVSFQGMSYQSEDLIRFGLIPEFIGRLPVITTLESLDKSALIKILTEPKNALTKQFKKLFRIEGVELDFRVEALNAIADKALERKSGARGLRSILEIALKETMFDLPTIRNLEKVVIDDGVIKDNKAPYLIFSKDEKQRQSK